MAKKYKNDRTLEERKEEVAGLIEKLAHGVKAITTKDDWKAHLRAQAVFHQYSFGNMMLIFGQLPEASRCAGYQAWKKLGRQVRKGEKGIRILAPARRKYEAENDKGETETKSALYFRAVSIFDISQTDGEPLPATTLCKVLDGAAEPASMALAILKAYAEGLGYSVEDEDLPEGLNGYCNFKDSRIVLRTDNPATQRAKTLAHEIGHALMHGPNDEIEHGSAASKMEVEAESFAFCIMDTMGIESDDYSFGYVAAWSKGKPEILKASAERIQRNVCRLLQWVETGEDIDPRAKRDAQRAAA